MSTFNSYEPPVAVVPTPTYDYGSIYSNIYTALNNIDADTTPMVASLALIATSLSTLATNSTTIAAQQTTMATKLTALEARAADQGIHIVGPWEWLGMSSIVKLYDEKGVDYNALKARVEQIPKGA